MEAERGAILALLGTAERVFVQIDRIVAERNSVDRTVQPMAPVSSEVQSPAAAVVPEPAH